MKIMNDNLDANLVNGLELINNMKLTVSSNVLSIVTISSGETPTATHPIRIAFSDADGITLKTRNTVYLSGTAQITMADATNYWSKGSLDAELKTAWLYAIWDGTGIIWALAGYSGFKMVSTTTTVTDDDYFLLEGNSTYSRSNSHYCICVAKIHYQYDTNDTPDHTIQSSGETAPLIIWNPKSDYHIKKTLATTNLSGGDIGAYSVLSAVAKQSGKYFINATISTYSKTLGVSLFICTGSATYASATQRSSTYQSVGSAVDIYLATSLNDCVYINSGDTIHLGAAVMGSTGNRSIRGDDNQLGATKLIFYRID
jgi:hypothetical protein